MFRVIAIAVLLPVSQATAFVQEFRQGASPSPDTSAPRRPRLKRPRNLQAKSRLEAAMAQTGSARHASPEPAGVERLRGMIFYQREQFPQAIDAFAKAGELDSSDHESVEMHGISLFPPWAGFRGDSVSRGKRASECRGANVDPNYVLALCYADVQRYDDARHAFAAQYGFALGPAEAYLLAGRLFLRRELRDEAGAEAAKAIALNPSLPLAHELLGEVALSSADIAGAIREFEAERKINPLNPDLYGRLGDALSAPTGNTRMHNCGIEPGGPA